MDKWTDFEHHDVHSTLPRLSAHFNSGPLLEQGEHEAGGTRSPPIKQRERCAMLHIGPRLTAPLSNAKDSDLACNITTRTHYKGAHINKLGHMPAKKS